MLADGSDSVMKWIQEQARGFSTGWTPEGLLPDISQRHETLADVLREVPAPAKIGSRLKDLVWLTTGLEDDFISAFPPRTKSDMAIRRTRAYDLWFHVEEHANCLSCKKPKKRLAVILRRIAGRFDYIAALNLGWAAVLFGTEWTELLLETAALDDDLPHFVSASKWLSDALKTRWVTDGNRFKWLELQSLSGYRNLPYAGFDLLKEAEAMASGGVVHKAGLDTFVVQAARALTMPRVEVDYVSRDDYIGDPARWATTGASSVGRMELTDSAGDTTTIKARKNVLADLLTAGELRALSSAAGQINVVLIKSELAKVRLAVSGDIGTYFDMDWLTYLLAGAYNSWPGATLEESQAVEQDRLVEMLRLAEVNWGVPFDFKAFDHQPTTDELVAIVALLCRHARLNVPAYDLSEFDVVAGRVLTSFRRATLTVKQGTLATAGIPGGSRSYTVTGGLMSGLRFTSILGNAFNTIYTSMVIDMVSASLGQSIRPAFVRGDDAAIFVPSYAAGALTDRGYKVLGLEAGAGKFSIRPPPGMEFLRVWFDSSCHGYPARTIPGLTQRKPWSDSGWEPDGVIKAIVSVCSTLARRGIDTSHAQDSLANAWCRFSRLPRCALQVPRAFGGLGLLTWDGKTRISPPIPRLRKSGFTAHAKTLWRRDRILAQATELRVALTSEAAVDLAQEELNLVVAADDVPAASSANRRAYRAEVRGMRFRVTRLPIIRVMPVMLPRNLNAALDSRSWGVLTNAGDFGSASHLLRQIVQSRSILRAAGWTLRRYLQLYQPALFLTIQPHRGESMTDRLAWLLGDVETPSATVHPALKKYVTALCSRTLQSGNHTRDYVVHIFSHLSGLYADTVMRTQLGRKVYMW